MMPDVYETIEELAQFFCKEDNGGDAYWVLIHAKEKYWATAQKAVQLMMDEKFIPLTYQQYLKCKGDMNERIRLLGKDEESSQLGLFETG